ncbi:MAG: cytochrome c biogenesis protein CcsA [Deltaproteobacteria bacterium]|nr:cytochrome c biogenesis protein CcsA [Deltaproteobacteria bacterium]MBW2359783.1 cytochrome c biogenesis protein CcsA [Deltaproteobacteria bacterium]
MAILLHQATAALYLLAGIVAWLGLALGARRLERGSVAILTLGGALHLVAFGALHALDPPPPLTDLPIAISYMACVGVLFFLLLSQWARLAGLVVGVAPVAFVSTFAGALRLHDVAGETLGRAGTLPHAHVLLASAGLACLGLAGLAGLLFLAEHRRLKAKRPLGFRFDLPSLEALDRVNLLSLVVGFPLLTLGVVTGAIWVDAVEGRFWSGSQHEIWSVLAWFIYAAVVAARFGAAQGARTAAASAVVGFIFLTFAVIGVGVFV